MASNLKRLQDRAAAIAARMTELADVNERSEDQTSELRRLSDEADKVKADLDFEGALATKEAELRAVLEKAAPPPRLLWSRLPRRWRFGHSTHITSP